MYKLRTHNRTLCTLSEGTSLCPIPLPSFLSSAPFPPNSLLDSNQLWKELDVGWYQQGRIQSKFHGGAVGNGGPENFSEIDDQCTLYTTISDLNYCQKAFHSICWGIFTIIVVYFEVILEVNLFSFLKRGV